MAAGKRAGWDHIGFPRPARGAALPRFIEDEFDAFLEFGILAHGFLRLRAASAAATSCWPLPGSALAKATVALSS